MKIRYRDKTIPMHQRFRGFLPVVVDIETGGVDPYIHPMLEIAIVLLEQDSAGLFHRGATFFEHVIPFEGAILDPQSLAFNNIDPYQPLRFAIEEKKALKNLYKPIIQAMKQYKCHRAVLVGHNAWFDLLFLKQAHKRLGTSMPFHPFTCFDTATLGGFVLGETVLSKALVAADLTYNAHAAHSAIYDAEVTADLFCTLLNMDIG